MDRKILSLILIVFLVVISLITIYLISLQAGLTGFAVKDSDGMKSDGLRLINEETDVLNTVDEKEPNIEIESSGLRDSGSRSRRSWSSKSSGNNGNSNYKIVEVFINPGRVDSEVGEDFTVSIEINAEVEVYAADFKLGFDESILEVKESVEGNFLKKDGASTYPIVMINEGEISFANTRLKIQKGVLGQGALAKITFKSKNKGSTNLNLEVKLVNSDLQKIQASSQNGQVNVS